MLRWMSDREKRMQASWDESNAVMGVSDPVRESLQRLTRQQNMRAVVDRLHASAAAVDIASATATDRLSVALSEA